MFIALRVLCSSLQVNTLKLALEGVEKERDYYFSKLREVELLCQEQGEENAPFVDRLMEVLYASDEQVSPQPQIELNGICKRRCLFSLQLLLWTEISEVIVKEIIEYNCNHMYLH